MTPRSLRLACLLIVIAPACGSSDGGAGSPPTPDAAAPAGPVMGLAVVHTDYKAASTLSLLDATTGAVTRGDCLTSGSKPAGLTTALSSDVVLPTQPQPNHDVVLIDRTNAVLTWVDPATCGVRRQLSVAMGLPANPHDVAAVSATKAYVTRYAAKDEMGSDVLVVDPSTGTAGKAISLRALVPAMADGKAIVPGPDRAVVAAGKVFVTLNGLSADFQAAAPGRVAVIDPATDTPSAIELPYRDCGAIEASADGSVVVVACSGLFGSDVARQAADSGLVWIDARATPPAVKGTTPATPFGRPVSGNDLALVSPTEALLIVNGDPMKADVPDLLFRVGEGGASRMVLTATGAYQIAAPRALPGAQRAFLADADARMPRLKLIDLATGAVVNTVASSPAGLPARYVAFY